jgi:murein DD-endopeptidase MepM/ murein hydrolase activator NlpD
MDKKYYTFLVFPGAHGALRKICLPFYILHLMLALSAVGIMTIAALANSYARMLLKVSNYNSLRTERQALKVENQTLQNVVSKTNAQLGSLQSLAAEVALTYGFGEAHRLRFPQAALALAAQTDSTLDSSYRASFYAFNLIKRWSLKPSGDAVALGIFPNTEFGRETIPSLWPVRGAISAGFGQRMDPFSGEDAFHRGVDIAAARGTKVEASADGLVLQAGPSSGYGNEILITHGSGLMTKYGHLSKIYVVVGEEVKRGQRIGAVGMTGRATGPHLHYEVIVNDTPVNPAKYLRGQPEAVGIANSQREGLFPAAPGRSGS